MLNVSSETESLGRLCKKYFRSKKSAVVSFITQEVIYFIVFVRKAGISANMAGTSLANSEWPVIELRKVFYLA
jgi:hypothetical protein